MPKITRHGGAMPPNIKARGIVGVPLEPLTAAAGFDYLERYRDELRERLDALAAGAMTVRLDD